MTARRVVAVLVTIFALAKSQPYAPRGPGATAVRGPRPPPAGSCPYMQPNGQAPPPPPPPGGNHHHHQRRPQEPGDGKPGSGNGYGGPSPPPPPCDATDPYRTPNGYCNNLASPFTANSYGPFIRLLPNSYADGISAPRTMSSTGQPLPSARLVSNQVHNAINSTNPTFSHFLMQWGQFVAHDIVLTQAQTMPNGSAYDCTACNAATAVNPNCFPIPIPSNDAFFAASNAAGQPNCLALTRIATPSQTGFRQQINENTPQLDASTVYGSDQCRTLSLRTMSNGLLNFTANINSQNSMALPQGTQIPGLCNSLPNDPCFEAGDIRNYLQPMVQVPQTLFLREHNRIATALKALQPGATDESLFQQARRIVIAEIQHITYNAFLSRVLGIELWTSSGLAPQPAGNFYNGKEFVNNWRFSQDIHNYPVQQVPGYQQCDSSIMLEFGVAAYRFGHSMVRETMPRLDANMNTIVPPTWLGSQYFDTDEIYNVTSGGVNSLAMGLLAAPAMTVDSGIADSVRDFLYSDRGNPTTAGDLAATNIQRGRDVGLAPYNQFRAYCNQPVASSFADLAPYFNAATLANLQATYASVDDIDAWTGMVSELPMPGAIVGPTAACIISQQFMNLKKCDRFFYENNNPITGFTIAQLNNIRQMTLSSIMCQNLPLTTVQASAFDQPSASNPINIPCSTQPKLNLALFTAPAGK